MDIGVVILIFDKNNKKNFVFDEERFEDIFLKCLICWEMFDEDEKMLKMLLCYYIFCLDCFK